VNNNHHNTVIRMLTPAMVNDDENTFCADAQPAISFTLGVAT